MIELYPFKVFLIIVPDLWYFKFSTESPFWLESAIFYLNEIHIAEKLIYSRLLNIICCLKLGPII